VDAFLRFLVQVEKPLYLTLAVAGVFVARSLFLAWREWRLSVFALEKELTSRRLRASGAAAILLVLLGLSVFIVVSFVVPFVPATALAATPTPNLLVTPQGGLPSGSTTALLAEPATVNAVGCLPGQLIITSVQPGQTLQGPVELIGTVDLPNFGFFKYEYALQGTENWVPIAAGRDPLRDTSLGVWNTSNLLPGDYLLRIVVTDNTGTALPPCVIPVRITAPATP